MDIKVFEPKELEIVLRALRSVAAANDAFTPAERDLVEGVAHLHDARVDADRLEPIAFEQVALVLRDPHRRKRAVQLAIVTAFVEGEPTETTSRAVSALARALDVPDEGVSVLYELSRGHSLSARIDMARRMRRFFNQMPGFPGFFNLATQFIGMHGEDPSLLARYEGLAKCKQGTLGRAFYDHYVDNGFPFPGAKHGTPELVTFHDIGHVFSGYGVDPQGEIQQAAFQAGFSRKDGFLFLLFGILQFHVGMRLTPIAKSERGYFDVPRVIRAVARGAACKVDFSEGYDLFAHADEDLEDLRARLGVPAA